MEDKLAVINRIIEWHQTIREHVRLVGDSLTDWEALLDLENIRQEWIPGQLEVPDEKQKKLQQAVRALEEGLQNHFAYEEQVLPPLLGELFMRALILDHQEIKREISRAKALADGVKLDRLSRGESLLKESGVQQTIGGLCQMIEEHASREETVLEMLRRALQENGGAGG